MGEQISMQFSDTSMAALASINPTQLERIVLKAIKSFGARGCISDEVLLGLPGYRYSSVTARYRGLLDQGLITVIGTRKGVSGRSQRVYCATNLEGKSRA